jgi:hypothetical protein
MTLRPQPATDGHRGFRIAARAVQHDRFGPAGDRLEQAQVLRANLVLNDDPAARPDEHGGIGAARERGEHAQREQHGQNPPRAWVA